MQMFLLTSCKDNGDFVVKSTPWENYLSNAVDMILSDFDLEKEELNIEVKTTLKTDKQKTDLFFGLNYNSKQRNESIFVLDMTRDETNLVSLSCNNENAYVNFHNNDLLGNAKFKIENVKLFDWLKFQLADKTSDDVKAEFKSILLSLGKMFFSDVEVNSDETMYSFKISSYSLQSENNLRYLEAISSILGEEFYTILLKNVFGVNDTNELLDKIPQIDGVINFHIENGKIEKIDSSKLVDTSDNNYDLQSNFHIQDACKTEPNYQVPQSDIGYKLIKLGSFLSNGHLGLYSDTSKAISYDYSFNANLDLLSLVLNDWDLSKLNDDNYFHFRLNHICNSKCTEFCESKTFPSKGAILDIVFSPREMGNFNIHIIMNVKSILNDKIYKILEYDQQTVDTILPNYYVNTISHQKINSKSFIAKMLMKNIGFLNGKQTAEIEIANILKNFENDQFAEILNASLSSDNFSNNKIVVNSQNCLFGETINYNLYNKAIHIIDDSESKTKSYHGLLYDFMNKFYLDIKLEESVKTNKGETYTNLYNSLGDVMHGNLNGEYVPISATELSSDNLYVKINYQNILKEWETKGVANTDYLRIKKIEDIDYYSNEIQDVTLVLDYPSPISKKGIKSFEIGNILGLSTIKYKAKIKITKEIQNSFNFVYSAENTPNKLTYLSEQIPAMLLGVAEISYVDGSTKNVRVVGNSTAVETVKRFIVNDQYCITACGLQKVEFYVAGRNIVKNCNILQPKNFEFEIDYAYKNMEIKTNQIVLQSNLKQFFKMYAIYEENGVDKKTQIYLDFGDFYINNLPLNQSSSNWEIVKPSASNENNIKFLRSNNYVVNILKLNQRSSPFILDVQKNVVMAEYKFENVTKPIDYYFTGYSYSFNAELKNLLHGESDSKIKAFTIDVFKGERSSSGIKFDTKLNENFNINANGVSGVNKLEYDVPNLISRLFVVRTNITFKEAGYYKIVMRLTNSDGKIYCEYEWKIKVEV